MRFAALLFSMTTALNIFLAPMASAENCGNVQKGKTSKGKLNYYGKFYNHEVSIEADNSLCRETVIIDWTHTCPRDRGKPYEFRTRMAAKTSPTPDSLKRGLLSYEASCDARIKEVRTVDAWERTLRVIPISTDRNVQKTPAAVPDQPAELKAGSRITSLKRPNPEIIPDAQTCFNNVNAFIKERTLVCVQNGNALPECEKALVIDNASLIEGCGKRPNKLP